MKLFEIEFSFPVSPQFNDCQFFYCSTLKSAAQTSFDFMEHQAKVLRQKDLDLGTGIDARGRSKTYAVTAEVRECVLKRLTAESFCEIVNALNRGSAEVDLPGQDIEKALLFTRTVSLTDKSISHIDRYEPVKT